MTNRLVGRAATAIFAFSVVAAACGSNNNSSSTTEAATTVETTTTASAQALCAARDQLKTSIEALPSAVQKGTSSLTSAIDEVKNNLQAVKSAASDQLKPEVDDFTTKLQAVQDAVGNAGSGGASQILTALSTAGTSTATLLSSLQSMSCPGDTGS